MKNISIRLKITLWFSVALVLIMAVTFILVISVSDSVIKKTIRDNLIETVENNVDEVEFYDSLSDVRNDSDSDHYIRYCEGYLEIDDDFLDEVNSVFTGLYDEESGLLYGENPIARETVNLEFRDAGVQSKKVNGTVYYVFDRKLTQDGLEGLWLRGVVSEEQGNVQMTAITRLSLVIMPLLVLLAIAGGYLIAGRMLKPIKKISATAFEISMGGDLNKRIDIGGGSDELHQLADNFNQMFERLDAAFKTERQFTSDASHELRTPMAVIMAQCEYSLEEPRSNEEYRSALDVIKRQGGKMSRLINDMLDFTRLESKGDGVAMGEVDFTALVSDTCTDMALIRENGIELTYEAEDGVMLRGNHELLTRMLTNLISNAYRYGKENGHIFVRLCTDERGVELTVSDDGIGISKEEQTKIFRRFYQSDSSRSGQGTGLGLSMVWEIVQIHKGTISVESEPEKGSRFIVKFPK